MTDIGEVLEVLYFVVILVGLWFGCSNLRATYLDWKADRKSEFSSTLLMGMLIQVSSRTAAQVLLLIAAVLSIVDPGHPGADAEHQTIAVSLHGVVFFVGVLLTVNSLVGWNMRRRLLSALDGEGLASLGPQKEE